MSTALSPLLAPMLSSAAMRAVCDDEAYLQHMLDFEASLAHAVATIAQRGAGAAIRRRRGHLGSPRRQGIAGGRETGAGAKAAAAGCAMAHPSRPHRRGGLRICRSYRNVRQDRPRRFA